MLQMRHDDVAVLLEDRKRDEDVEVGAVVVGPQRLPQTQNVSPLELALVPDKQHAEEEEEVGRVGRLEVEVQLRVHELHEVVERHELLAHARLVAEEVSLHAVHKADETPEGDCVVLHDCIDGREEIAHALDVAEVLVVLVVGKEHILHLFEVYVRPNVGERRIWIGVRDVLSFEDGNVAICSVHILLY